VEMGDWTNAGLAGEELVGDRVERMTQGTSEPDSCDFDCDVARHSRIPLRKTCRFRLLGAWMQIATHLSLAVAGLAGLIASPREAGALRSASMHSTKLGRCALAVRVLLDGQ